MSDLKIQGVVEMSSEGAESALDRVGNKAVSMASKVGGAAEKAGESVDKIGAGAGASADQMTRAEKRMLDSIKRVQTQFDLAGKSASQVLEYKIDAKGLDAAKFEPMLAKLRETEAAAKKTSVAVESSMNTMGLSAKQLSASLRGVPAQFTDIVTSLQSGQAPLTVLMQQGGQLKDMFGGVGNAVKAMGGYIAGLVTPFTVAAGTAGLFATALYKGAEESRALSESLIMTGNAAGLSVGSLYKMADGVSALTLSTKGLSVETLSQVAATGKIASGNIALVAEAAIKMQKATGQAIDETVKQFAELGKSPVDASVKLTEKYNYLTGEIYLQIKALEEQGRTLDAAALAQREWANALTDRSGKIIDDLGAIQTAWLRLGNVAKHAWDSMLGLGRAETLEDQLAAAIRKRDGYYEERGGGNTGDRFTPGDPTAQAKIDALKYEIELRDKAAKGAQDQAIATAKTVETQKLREKYLTNEQKLSQEIAKINNSSLTIEEKRNAIAQATERLTAKVKAARSTSSDEYSALFAFSDRMTQINKELTAELNEIDKANQAYAKSVAALLDPLAKEAGSLEAQLENYGLTRTEIEANTLARLEEQRVILSGQQGYSALVEQLDKEIELRKRIRDASAGIDQKKAWEESAKEADKAAQSALDDWNKTSEKIGDSITDALMRGFESGKDLAENLRDSIENMFATLVLRPIVQATVVGGMSAVGMGPAMAADGSISGAGNLLSAGSSAWDLMSGGSSLYSSFATSGVGSALGLSAGLSSTLGVAGGAGSVMGSSAALAAAEATSAGAMGITSLGSAIGSAIPVVGLAVGAASLLGGLLGDKGGPKTEGDFIGHIKADGSIEQESTRYSKRAASDALAAAAPSLAKTISQTIASLGGDATGIGLRYWSSVDPEGTAGDMGKSRVFDADGNLVYKNSWTVDRGEYAQELALEFQRMTLAAINATDVPTIFKDVVDGVNLAKASAEELAAALQDVQGIAQLRKAFDLVDLGADNLSLSLIDFSGGIETLAGNLSSYYEAYFSESERLTNTAQRVAESFADMGQAIPQNTAGFRSLVESLDLTTDAGKETFASLMSVQSAFASVMAAIDGLKDGVANATLALRSEQEQAVIQQQKLADAANAAGVAIPQSVDELLRLADGIDYTTAAGLQLAAAMPELASAFSTVKTAAETAIKALASTASDTYDIAVEYADAAVDAAQTALDAARDVAERSINAAYESASSALESQINNLQSISSTIANALASNGVENSLAGYRMAQQGLELALAQMRSGISPDAASVSSMVGKATGLNSDWFASQSDMLRAQARTNATLSELGKVTGSQQTAAEAQLTALKAQYEEQINALNGIDGTVKSVEEALADYAKAQKALKTAEFQREQVEIGKAQLDELNGVNNGIDSLADAMQSLNDSIYALALATMQAVTKPVGNYTSTNGATYSAETDTWTTKAGEGTTESLSGILQNIFQSSGASATYHAATNAGLSIRDVDRIANLTAGTTYQAASKEIKESVVAAAASGGAMAAYEKAKALGLTMDQLDALMVDGDPNWYPGLTEEWAKANQLPTFATGGYHSGGLRLVGERGPELEVTGPSQIINSDLTRRLMGGNNEELLEELKSVKAELAAMRAANEATARNTFSTKQSLDRVVDGDAILTRAAA